MLPSMVVTFKWSFTYCEKAIGLTPSAGDILRDPSSFLSEAVGFHLSPKKTVPPLPPLRPEPSCIYWLEFTWKSRPNFLLLRHFKFAEKSVVYFLKLVLVSIPSWFRYPTEKRYLLFSV